MEIHGSEGTFNVEMVLRRNILDSDYFRTAQTKLETWYNVVDEIYNSVEHAEPWMSGNARGPSTAFCLLYRFFTMKLDENHIQGLIDHTDSPFIRAIGFLYLRYVCDPKKLWDWFGPYVQDEEKITPSPNGREITMGEYIRDLLLYQYYFETIFPRIPLKVEQSIQQKLEELGLPTEGKGNGGQGGPNRRGGDEPNRRPASVKASLSVSFGQRAPNRAGVVEGSRRTKEHWEQDRNMNREPYNSRNKDGAMPRDARDDRNYRNDRDHRDYRNDRGRDDRRMDRHGRRHDRFDRGEHRGEDGEHRHGGRDDAGYRGEERGYRGEERGYREGRHERRGGRYEGGGMGGGGGVIGMSGGGSGIGMIGIGTIGMIGMGGRGGTGSGREREGEIGTEWG